MHIAKPFPASCIHDIKSLDLRYLEIRAFYVWIIRSCLSGLFRLYILFCFPAPEIDRLVILQLCEKSPLLKFLLNHIEDLFAVRGDRMVMIV